jgi:hypothetical protein
MKRKTIVLLQTNKTVKGLAPTNVYDNTGWIQYIGPSTNQTKNLLDISSFDLFGSDYLTFM